MPNEKSHEARGSKGGEARAKNLSLTRRAEIARDAALARWSTDIPQALVEGDIGIDFGFHRAT